MDIEESFLLGLDNAIGYFAGFFVIALIYTWARILLSLWIEENEKAYTMRGKLITVLFCLSGSIIVAIIIGFLFKSWTAAMTAIIISIPASAIAAYQNYQKYK